MARLLSKLLLLDSSWVDSTVLQEKMCWQCTPTGEISYNKLLSSPFSYVLRPAQFFSTRLAPFFLPKTSKSISKTLISTRRLTRLMTKRKLDLSKFKVWIFLLRNHCKFRIKNFLTIALQIFSSLSSRNLVAWNILHSELLHNIS